MNTISFLSSIAMAVGLAAALPQILTMLRTRSSGGQSVVGWGMGLVTNLSMAYVNLFGFGAAALMASNLLSAALCVAAMLLIVRFGARRSDDQTDADGAATAEFPALRTVPASMPVRAGRAPDHGTLADLPTTEFIAISEAVAAATDTRAQRYRERDVLLAA